MPVDIVAVGASLGIMAPFVAGGYKLLLSSSRRDHKNCEERLALSEKNFQQKNMDQDQKIHQLEVQVQSLGIGRHESPWAHWTTDMLTRKCIQANSAMLLFAAQADIQRDQILDQTAESVWTRRAVEQLRLLDDRALKAPGVVVQDQIQLHDRLPAARVAKVAKTITTDHGLQVVFYGVLMPID